MTAWRCIETDRIHTDNRWLRFRFAFWRPLATRFQWPHRVCRHYIHSEGHA